MYYFFIISNMLACMFGIYAVDSAGGVDEFSNGIVRI